MNVAAEFISRLWHFSAPCWWSLVEFCPVFHGVSLLSTAFLPEAKTLQSCSSSVSSGKYVLVCPPVHTRKWLYISVYVMYQYQYISSHAAAYPINTKCQIHSSLLAVWKERRRWFSVMSLCHGHRTHCCVSPAPSQSSPWCFMDVSVCMQINSRCVAWYHWSLINLQSGPEATQLHPFYPRICFNRPSTPLLLLIS